MMYQMTLSMFSKEGVKGKEGCDELLLVVEGKSPKGKFSFACKDEDANELYNQLITDTAFFIDDNQSSVFESLKDLEENGREEEPLLTKSFDDSIECHLYISGEDDLIGSPSHYTSGRKYEPRKVIEDWDLDWNLGNTVKYISRAGRKDNKVQDLEKAKQYLEWAIEEAKKE